MNWLDPSKPAARTVSVRAWRRRSADLGFDEILLTDVGYPTTGPLDKIDYNGADRAESIRTFLEELRTALAEYGVALSVELPAEVITSGRDDTAGLALADIAPAGGPGLRRHHGGADPGAGGGGDCRQPGNGVFAGAERLRAGGHRRAAA